MEIPQRVLAVKLRTAIDRAMRHPSTRWVEAVQRLRRENPRGSNSSHVRHNLGAARRAWLARLDTMVTDTRSLEVEMVRKHEIPATKKEAKGAPKQEKDQAIRGDAVPEKKG